MKYFDTLLYSGKTVFTYDDLQLLLSMHSKDTIKSFFARGVAEGLLINITKGMYGLKNYQTFELASKLKTNSYISFETVLKASGIIFQDYGNTIFCTSDNTITKQVGNTNFCYLKIKDSIRTNPLGLIHKWSYIIASPERAVCDRLYLSANYYFDNLEWIDYELLARISQIYNKRVILSVQQLIHHAQSRTA